MMTTVVLSWISNGRVTLDARSDEVHACNLLYFDQEIR